MKSFTIYKEYYELITLLSEKEQQELLLGITKYMFEGVIPKLNDRQNKIFSNLKRPLDISKNRSKCGSITRTNQNQNEIKIKSNQNQNEIKQGNTSNDVYVNVNVDVNNLYEYIESNFNRTLSPIEYEVVSKWEDNEITRYAIQEAVLNRAYSVKYIQAILDRLKIKGITSVAEISKKKKEIPSWVNQENKSEKATVEEIVELEKLMEECK